MDRFRDRREAGRRLAEAIGARAGPDALVLGLPRGGVPVAHEVAKALGLPLDVMVARKIGAPRHPEFAIGAVAPGVVLIDEASAASVEATRDEITRAVALEQAETTRRFEAYRGAPHMPDVSGRTIVLVDDGLATGATARAAVRALRLAGARRIVLAVPVAPAASIALLRQEADDVVAVLVPDDFVAVGQWYDEFGQTSDVEVQDILAEAASAPRRRELSLDADGVRLDADLVVPPNPCGLVVFAHGSGSGRKSPRNRAVAATLNEASVATLLVDLLTPDEGRADERTAKLRFDIDLLARRVASVVDAVAREPGISDLRVGLFGASTGAAAALAAAAERPDVVTVVSRGGRPDLAGDALPRVRVPVLLLVGGLDEEVLHLNEQAAKRLGGPHELVLIAGATHLFEEPGTLEEVAAIAAEWFRARLTGIPHGQHPVPG